MELTYLLFPMIISKMDLLLEYWMILFPLFVVYYLIKNPNFINNIEDIYDEYFKPIPKGTIVLEAIPGKNKNSQRYQAVMWYLSNNNNETIYKSHEVFYKKYNYRSEKDVSKHFFRIDQEKEFIIKDDIYGKVETIQKEEKQGDTSYKEDNFRIKIFSKNKKIPELIKFLDKLVDMHQKEQINKTLSKPIIIEAIFNNKDDSFDFYYYNWESNVTFENRFFEDKDKIIKQIDFFLNNHEYFEKKGIPYQLGILLHGIPGCGKTSFIKALAKKTNRHIIDVKINNNINLSELKHLFLEEELNENLIIPIDKRLYVLEDIDVMGNLVHKRKNNINLEDSDKDSIFEDGDLIKINSETKDVKNILKLSNLLNSENKVSICEKNNTNNNMSYLLNILDGIQENKGRIIIMTTNHIDKIDPAIIRPGRIDINIEFKLANKKIIEKILSHYWEKNVVLDSTPNDMPHCKVVEFCRSSQNLNETIEKIFSLSK